MSGQKQAFKKFIVLFLILGAITSACNPSRRAQRHVRKAIALDPTISLIDTIHDTIHAKRVDTLVSLPFGKPTVITKDGITLTLRPVEPMNVNPIISVTAETETEIREIPVERIKYVTNPPTFWDEVKNILVWVFLALLVLLILRSLIDKIFSK